MIVNGPCTLTPNLPIKLPIETKNVSPTSQQNNGGVGEDIQCWERRQKCRCRAFLPSLPTLGFTLTIPLQLKKIRPTSHQHNVGGHFWCWEGRKKLKHAHHRLGIFPFLPTSNFTSWVEMEGKLPWSILTMAFALPPNGEFHVHTSLSAQKDKAHIPHKIMFMHHFCPCYYYPQYAP